MAKFDATCGLLKKEVDITKYQVKQAIERKLPILPEFIETKLFFQGRDAYTYRWDLAEIKSLRSNPKICLIVTAKLKKEFHEFMDQKQHKFSCMVSLKDDIYNPEIEVKEEQV